jgi:hypothetical protein
MGETVTRSEFDTLTTMCLIWLRVAHHAGFVMHEPRAEEKLCLEHLLTQKAGVTRPHLRRYLEG